MKVSSLSPCGSRRAKLALRGLGRGVHTGGPDAAKVHTGSPDAATPSLTLPHKGGGNRSCGTHPVSSANGGLLHAPDSNFQTAAVVYLSPQAGRGREHLRAG